MYPTLLRLLVTKESVGTLWTSLVTGLMVAGTLVSQFIADNLTRLCWLYSALSATQTLSKGHLYKLQISGT